MAIYSFFFILVCLWKVHEDSYIKYHNKEIKSNATADECKDHCATITKYTCLTFDYSDNTCFFSTWSRSQAVEIGMLLSDPDNILYECSK